MVNEPGAWTDVVSRETRDDVRGTRTDAERKRSAELARSCWKFVNRALSVATEQRDLAVREARADERARAARARAAELGRVRAASKRLLAMAIRKARAEARRQCRADLVLLRAQVREAFRQHQLAVARVLAEGQRRQAVTLDAPGAGTGTAGGGDAARPPIRRIATVPEPFAAVQADLNEVTDFAAYLDRLLTTDRTGTAERDGSQPPLDGRGGADGVTPGEDDR